MGIKKPHTTFSANLLIRRFSCKTVVPKGKARKVYQYPMNYISKPSRHLESFR